MKKITLLATILILTTSSTLLAQTKEQSAALTTAFAKNQFSIAFNYQYLWKLGKKKQWGIGTGARLTNSFGNLNYYSTAPAKLTTGKTGLGVFFGDDIPKNIDSVYFKKSQINALNITVNFTYNINQKLKLGFNIDAIGFTVGGKQNGTYFPNTGIVSATTAKPTAFNLLLVSDNDLGSLNSEFFAQYNYNKKWGAKLGFQYLFTEYTTTTKVQTTPDGQKKRPLSQQIIGCINRSGL